MAKDRTPKETAAPEQELQSKSESYELPTSVAEKFELVGNQLHAYFPGFGEIDMRQLTVKAAQALVANGFPYLKEK